ncbi:hypothetical protein W97_05052 [Coniosporium apollinis CBS 100218]|uniref:Uncharacterized protein n=1 Tax=Coniosporium apollinis (strain CBS 100218) TaxID=1168221 RepID=R7YVD6_CONA1|nr:uncharacterized protein W97_05052 [Coniosporium apollinis CBS 100218]EON65813.1 hypothetical protein W97_05052 [Coniosporium apollinis CBS 100218]
MHLESFITSILSSSTSTPAATNPAAHRTIDPPSSRLTTTHSLTPFLSSEIKARRPPYEAPKALKRQLWTPLLPTLDRFKSPSPSSALAQQHRQLDFLMQAAKPRPRLSAFEPLQDVILRHLLAPSTLPRLQQLPGPRSRPFQLVIKSSRILGREWRRLKRAFKRTLIRMLIWMGVPEVIMVVELRVEMDVPILPWIV